MSKVGTEGGSAESNRWSGFLSEVGNAMNMWCLALAMVVLLTACGSPEERKAEYRLRAQEYMQSANYPKARVALRNVLKIDPKDAEAYYLFARVEEEEKNWRNAVQLYQEVVQLAPEHTGALIMLGKYYLEARLLEQVLKVSETVLKKDPQHPQARALQIAAQVASTNDAVAAIPQAEALLKEFPTEPDVAILLATLYSHQQRYRDAEVLLRHALDVHPTSLDLLNNLDKTLMLAKDTAGVETLIRYMIQIHPKSFDHRLRLARLYSEQGTDDKAETVLREAVALEPDSVARRLTLADFLMRKRDASIAEQALLDAVTHLPNSTDMQLGLAGFYAKGGQVAKARERYMAIVDRYKEKPAALDANVRLAELDLIAGNRVEAERRVEEVLKQNPRSADALILSGRMALAKRNGKDAVQAFRTVLHDQPDKGTVQFLLGQAYELTGETNLAKESFERAVALYPDQVDAKRSLAVLESKSGRYQQARSRLDDLLKQRPDDLAALEMMMTLDLVTKNWKGAEQTLSQLRRASHNSYVAFLAEGRLHEAERRFEESSQAYERAMSLAPGESEPMVSFVKLAVARGQAHHAIARLESLLVTSPDHPIAHGLLGEVLAIVGRFSEAESQFREAVRLNPRWTTPWLEWAGLWRSQKKPDMAAQVLQEGLQANPESEELQMLMAAVYSDGAHIDAAIGSYEAVLRLNRKNVLAANNLAAILVDYKRDQASLEKAFALSRDFEKEAPHPLFLDTLAWVRFKMGQQEEALRLMKSAVEKSPETAILNFHLGVAFFQAGQSTEARYHLTKALKSSEPFPGRQEAEQVLAQITRG